MIANTRRVWKSVQYGVSKELEMAYWGFLGVGTTFNIFQNLHILYLEYGVLTSSGYGVLNFFPLAVQDQMQKQFDVGVSKMKDFRAKRIATDKMTSSFKEHYSLLREYASCTTIRIDVQQEQNPDSQTRTFRRVYVCLGSLKHDFRGCGREILGLNGCFMLGPWLGQILTAVGVDANNGIYPVAYVIVEALSKASWYWFLNLLRENLGIEANFNYTFISNRQK
ncbi:mutator type transposase, partial [Tanacetum coccineum]